MPIKLVILKPGLDSHYRGALMVARYLASRGLEVVFLGNQQPAAAARAAVEEDADVLGISSLSGNHRTMVPAILHELRELGAGDMLVVLGGIIPEVDRPALFQAGVHGIYGPGTPLSYIADEVVAAVRVRDALVAPMQNASRR
jgi:methylmalonyl-CoA mutase C-terminal domain/subunit